MSRRHFCKGFEFRPLILGALLVVPLAGLPLPYPSGAIAADIIDHKPDTSATVQAGPSEEAQNPDPQRLFSLAAGERDPSRKKEGLKSLRAEFPGTVWSKRAAFLEAAGGSVSSIETLEALLLDDAGLEHIRDYIIFSLAVSYEGAARRPEAVALYEGLLAVFPDSALSREARIRRAEALFTLKEYKRSREAFQEFVSVMPRDPFVPDALLRSAECSVEMGDEKAAAVAAKRVITDHPSSGAAQKAERIFKTLRNELSAEEAYLRSTRLFDSGSFGEAARGLEEILKGKKGEYRERAAVKLAHARIRQKRFKEAEKSLREYLSWPRPLRQEREAAYLLALAGARQERADLVEEALGLLEGRYPESNEYSDALMLAGRLYLGKDNERALNYFRAAEERTSGRKSWEDALWSRGWTEYISGDYNASFHTFLSYRRKASPVKDPARFEYWAARSLERGGFDASESFARICGEFEASFYCMMAKRRTPAATARADEAAFAPPAGGGLCLDTPFIDGGFEACGKGTAQGSGPVSSDTHYLAAAELFGMGLKRLASGEFDLLLRRYGGDGPSLAAVSRLYYKNGDYFRSLAAFQAYLRASGGDPEGLSGEISFPLPVTEMARALSLGGIDPYLVSAVMREESRFNPEVVSSAGAMGLMQIMPATGRQIARELGTGFDTGDLFDPDKSIAFGSWYLGSLYERFNGDLILTIAGYNAGPHMALKWAGELPEEADEFIESIPYGETRNYTKKVLRSYGEFMRHSGLEFTGITLRPPKSGPVEGRSASNARQEGKSSF